MPDKQHYANFFRWLYNQDESDPKKRVTTPCICGVRPLPRKEISPYTPGDIWTNQEHNVFLKYCPSVRNKCYHAMASDTSARPHELLSLRIKSIIFKNSSNGTQYGEGHISDSKTNSRTLPLIFSVPYVKDWLDSHPFNNRPDAFLFPPLSDNNFGERLTENSLYKQYTPKYQKNFFPKLLNDRSIPEADKAYNRSLLTKPWNPYIQRHSGLTHIHNSQR